MFMIVISFRWLFDNSILHLFFCRWLIMLLQTMRNVRRRYIFIYVIHIPNLFIIYLHIWYTSPFPFYFNLILRLLLLDLISNVSKMDRCVKSCDKIGWCIKWLQTKKIIFFSLYYYSTKFTTLKPKLSYNVYWATNTLRPTHIF